MHLATSKAPLVLGADHLKELAGSLADDPGRWVDRVRLSAEGRWYERLGRDAHHGAHADHGAHTDHEIWLISWLPGQSTGFHDHGGSSGAFAVALGSLEEQDLSTSRTLRAGDVRGFGPDYIHHVHNTSTAPAVSVHVYSPPLTVMNRYDVTGAGLVRLAWEEAAQW